MADIEILSTKVIDNKHIAKALDYGIAINCHSFIHVHAMISPDVDADIDALATIQPVVVFTSKNAVNAVADRLKDVNVRWRIYCISGATLAAVHDRFPSADIQGTAEDANRLANDIAAKPDIKSIVFFHGDKALQILPETLRNNGITVNEHVVYSTILTPYKLNKTYNGIIFFSPSAVESFFLKNAAENDVTFFCIGETTASSLKQYPNEIVVSNYPDVGKMTDTLIEYYSKSKTV